MGGGGVLQPLRAWFSGSCLAGSSMNLGVAPLCLAIPRGMSDLVPTYCMGPCGDVTASAIRCEGDGAHEPTRSVCPPACLCEWYLPHAEAVTTFPAVGSPRYIAVRVPSGAVDSLLCSATAGLGAAVGHKMEAVALPLPLYPEGVLIGSDSIAAHDDLGAPTLQ